jgi:hypothetical protein
LEEVDSSSHEWLWVVQDFCGDVISVTVDVVKRELELDMGPGDVSGLLQYHDRSLRCEGMHLSCGWEKRRFLILVKMLWALLK